MLPAHGRETTKNKGRVVYDKTELLEENLLARKLLWLHHGCPSSALYGDDGEMQCHACLIDFRRASFSDIEYCWSDPGIRALMDKIGW